MAITEYYVDPSLGSDTGDGTSTSTPWGRATGSVIKYALETGITTQGTDGDRINVKSGATDTLESVLDFSNYPGTPTQAKPVIIQGYDTAANDRGRATIDTNGNDFIDNVSLNHIHLIDLNLSGWPTNSYVVAGNDGWRIISCEFDAESRDTRGIDLDSWFDVSDCRFLDFAGSGSADIVCGTGGNGGVFYANYFRFAGSTIGIRAFNYCTMLNNIMSISSTDSLSIGINAYRQNTVIGNSIYNHSAGTGAGISTYLGSSDYCVIKDNIVGGFSDTGGMGYDIDVGQDGLLVSGNVSWNNTTHYSYAGKVFELRDNEELSGSNVFAASGSDTYANRMTYFAPQNEGNIWGGAIDGRRDKGAVQRAAGGGGLAVFRSRQSGLIGR